MNKVITLSEGDRRLIADMIRRDMAEQAIDPNPRPARKQTWAAKLYVAKVPDGEVLRESADTFPGVLPCEMYRMKEFRDATDIDEQGPTEADPICEYVQITTNPDAENPVYWKPRVFNTSQVPIFPEDGFFPVHKTETGHWIVTFPPYRSKWAKTQEGGIAEDSSALVTLESPTGSSPWWEAGTLEVTAYNRGAAIGADVLVLLIMIDGRWCAFEVC